MTNRHPVRVAAAVALATLMFSPGGAVAAAPDDRSIVCHPTAQAGLKPMSLGPKGVAAHVAHGDGTPGDEVRGQFGVKLNDACGLVPSLLVTVAGPEGSPDAIDAISSALDEFTSTNPGIPTRYIAVDDIDALVAEASATGEQPMLKDPDSGDMASVDVLVVSQPGAIAPLVESGAAVPAAPDTIIEAEAGWDDDWLSYGRVDGTLVGVPTSSGLKSLVWYKTSTFKDPGEVPYDVPTTWQELLDLTDTMIDNGQTPWCVGLESGQATGWVFTDWVEDRLLGSEPVGVYDEWIINDVGFTDTRIRDAWNDVVGLWHTEDAVFEGLTTAPAPGVGVAQTHFVDSLFNLVGDSCLMHRQGSFSAEIIAGEDPGSLAALSTFPFPADDGAGTAIIGNGHYALALDVANEVALVHEYLASADYVDARRGVQPGFLSANQGQTLPTAGTLERGFVDQMLAADTMRFDASDSMPEAVGAGPLQTGKKFKFEEYWVFPSQPTGFWGEGLRAVIGPGNTSVEQWLGFEEPNKVFVGDVDGKTVDEATQTLADLFCAVAGGGSCP